MELDCTIGNYCRAVALSTVLRYYDYPLSEAMCFGLGAALDFTASQVQFGKHGEKKIYCFSGNSSNDVYYISHLLHLDFRILQTENFRKTFELMKEIVNIQQQPLIAKVCIKMYLPYLRATMLNHSTQINDVFDVISTPASNHVTVVSWIDNKSVTIHEPNMMDASIIPNKVFYKALNPKSGFISPSANTFYYIRPSMCFEDIRPKMPKLIVKAIFDNMVVYLNRTSRFHGISSLDYVYELIREDIEYQKRKEMLTMFRFFCDIVTGGGFYRRLYANFLKEANLKYLHDNEMEKCFKKYAQLARLWSKLAKSFQSEKIVLNVQELQNQIYFVINNEKEAAQMLYQVAERLRNVL